MQNGNLLFQTNFLVIPKKSGKNNLNFYLFKPENNFKYGLTGIPVVLTGLFVVFDLFYHVVVSHKRFLSIIICRLGKVF